MSESKTVMKIVDMPHEMQQDAVDCAKQGLENYEKIVVCQFTEVTFLVGCLVGCELPNVDTLPFFRMLQVI